MAYAICLGKDPNKRFEVYSDASWAADIDDRHSMTGGFFMLAGAPIDQICTKQGAVLARSAFEAELISIYTCSPRFVHLRNLLAFFDYPIDITTDFWNDNETTVQQITDHCITKRTRHIDLRYFSIADYIQKGLLKVRHILGKNNIADFLTKILPSNLFRDFRSRLLSFLSPSTFSSLKKKHQ